MNILANGRFILLALVFSMLSVSLAGCGGKQLPSQWSESKKEAFKQDLSKAIDSGDQESAGELITKKYGVGADENLPESEKEILKNLMGEVFMEKMRGAMKDAFPGLKQ